MKNTSSILRNDTWTRVQIRVNSKAKWIAKCTVYEVDNKIESQVGTNVLSPILSQVRRTINEEH
jgi:hypothetical protein